MEKIIVFLVLLRLAMTLSGQEFIKYSIDDYSLNPQYDATIDQVKSFYNFLQVLDMQTITTFFEEWISQNKTINTPSTAIKSENVAIYFSKFIPNEVIVPIPNLFKIEAVFKEYFEFTFRKRPKDLQIEGHIKFIRPGNTSSSCEIAFDFNFTLSVVKFMIRNMENAENFGNKEINLTSVQFEKKNFTQIELDEKSCVGINETQRQSTFNYVLQAMENIIVERIKLAKNSIFQSMSNIWFYSDTNSYKNDKKYSLFVTECSAVMSSRVFDYNEVIIYGLNNIYKASMEYYPEGETVYEIRLQDNIAKIRWNFASVMKMHLNFDVRRLRLWGTYESMDDMTVENSVIMQIENNDYALVDEKILDSLQILLVDGIMRTIQNIKYDGATDFTNAMQKVLRLFDTNMHLFVNFEKLKDTRSHLNMISFFGIEIEAFHLGNITWLQSNNSKIGIGRLIYRKINGQANFSHPVRKDDILLATAPASAKVYIKEAIFEISLEYNLNSTNEVSKTQINDGDFKNADATITITSIHYRIRREERIDIGKLVLKYFVETIRDQIFDVTKSTFRAIFDICLLNNTTAKAGRSNIFAIRDCWHYTIDSQYGATVPVDMIIAGFWNFESINVQYNNKKLIINGMQLENATVTTNIKQFGSIVNLIVTNYSMSYFSLTINHADNDIAVKIPPKVEITSVDSYFPNILSSSQTTLGIMNQIESTIASFYRKSIYEYLAPDSNYREKFRNFTNEIMMKTIREDTPSKYDISSQFTSHIIQKLNEKGPFLDFTQYFHENNASIFSTSDYISMVTGRRSETREGKIFIQKGYGRSAIRWPFIQEEICIFDHFQNTNSTVEQVITNGTADMGFQPTLSVWVEFAVTSNRIMDTFGNYYNENERIYIDDKNMMDIWLEYNATTTFEPDNETMTTEIALMTSSFIRNCLKKNSSFRSFCESTFNSKQFIVISNIVDYPSRPFSIYHIKLFGLHNFESLRMNFSSMFVTEFETTTANLTARIIWSYYLNDIVSRKPKILDMLIRNITLCGKILNKKLLFFNDRSQIRFSVEENSKLMNMLKETIGPIILRTIQQMIQDKYNEIRGN